jgi:hypothetical protein
LHGYICFIPHTKNKYFFIKLVFYLLFHTNHNFLPLCKNGHRPKIKGMGTLRPNDLFQKKSFIFNLTRIKHQKLNENKNSFLLLFSVSLKSKKVKWLLGLKKILFTSGNAKTFLFPIASNHPKWIVFDNCSVCMKTFSLSSVVFSTQSKM